MSARAPRSAARAPRQSENQVENDILRFLHARRWIIRRQHSGVFHTRMGTPIRLGEPGMADWSAMRSYAPGLVEYLEVEVKATTKKPKPEQAEYLAKRKYQGIACCWVDSLERFEAWYVEEGFHHADP